MDKLISKYNAERGANFELECKFAIPYGQFDDIYSTVINDKNFTVLPIEMTANVLIPKESGSDIIKYTYHYESGDLKSTISYHTKAQVGKYELKGAVYSKWTLSKEQTSSIKFKAMSKSIIRYKLRVSLVHKDMPDWRWDFTFGRQNTIDEIKDSMEQIKLNIFKKDLTYQNLLSVINQSNINTKELELEFIGKNSIVTMNNIDSVMNLVYKYANPDHEMQVKYQDYIYQIAKYISDNPEKFKESKHRLKELTNQVLAVPKNVYYSDVYPPINYYVTPKADGTRVVLFVNGSTCVGVSSSGFTEYALINSSLEAKLSDEKSVTIVDAELINNTMYIFDVMVIDDINLSTKPFSERYTYLEEASTCINNFTKAEPKEFIKIGSDIAKDIDLALSIITDYPTDGLILTSPDASYSKTKSYKWKPASHITIDFLAMKCPKSLLGIKPYSVQKDKELYLLFVGISHQMREKLSLALISEYKSLFNNIDSQYYPIQFSPSGNPLAYLYYRDSSEPDVHGKIIELSRELPNKYDSNWIFHRVRTDRSQEKSYYGNDYRVAELTWQMYDDPFNVEDLSVANAGYFTKTADNIYKSANAFKRFALFIIMKANLYGADWVVDLAAGRGGDLSRYVSINVKNGVFIDKDATAIAELIRRKFTIKSGGNENNKYDISKVFSKKPKGLTVHTMVADLKSPADVLITNMYQYGVSTGTINGFVCNFALHYMCDTLEHITQLLKFISEMAVVGAVFIFTVMDGKKVFESLSDTGKWSRMSNSVVKYAIEKRYTGKTLAKFGQTIAVKLPFADEMYEEPLCNVDAVVSIAKSMGWAVEIDEFMTERLESFKAAAPFEASMLSEEDLDYISLHKCVTMRKIK